MRDFSQCTITILSFHCLERLLIRVYPSPHGHHRLPNHHLSLPSRAFCLSSEFFLVGGNASCTVAPSGAVCGTRVRLADGPSPSSSRSFGVLGGALRGSNSLPIRWFYTPMGGYLWPAGYQFPLSVPRNPSAHWCRPSSEVGGRQCGRCPTMVVAHRVI